MEAERMVHLIRRMYYGDALEMGRWLRLEYLQPAYNPLTGLGGFDYYKLVTLSRSYIVHIRSPRLLPLRQRQIAERLVALGVQPQQIHLVALGARTSPDAPRWRLPHLLKLQIPASL